MAKAVARDVEQVDLVNKAFLSFKLSTFLESLPESNVDTA